ncbi:transcription factor ATOH8 isoform X2 [Emydura macquarii macquarii]|uniref:transcription factor ATOH8 isoform X2 n=1 Tax=Emydura macquarii macquarii TaxID=1129001 RepID=UPI00352BA3B8
MKNMPLLDEEPWPSLCVKEIGGLKKLKRRNKEAGPAAAAAAGHGYRSYRVALKVSERPAGGMLRAAAEDSPEPAERPGASKRPALLLEGREAGGAAGLLAGRPGAFPAGLASQAPAALNGFEAAQPYPEPSLLPSRILLCQPPLESAYPSAAGGAHGTYSHPPEPAASPRKRLGEGAGVSSEIKAIQQTRRLLANARERTRVHTISAAFEALRKQVPCYSYGQKLSKLAILRIACNYILSLARLADMDYSADHSNMSFSECVEQCTKTLQAEGRSKKRKE